MPFTAFIDESGDAGIKKLRDENSGGASPYFVLAAVVAQPATVLQARHLVRDFRSEISKEKWKHATELDHSQKVYFARKLSRLNVRYFSVISNKSTLGGYKETIEGDSQYFYNKCLSYLLEKICSYLSQFGVSESELSVVLEERNHDYDKMLRYFRKVKDSPIYSESNRLRILNPFAISVRAKGKEDCLEIADFAAHALYQCVNRSEKNFGIPEYRYFKELSGRFAGNNNGSIIDVGLKCIHSIAQLELDPEVKEIFTSVRVQPPRKP